MLIKILNIFFVFGGKYIFSNRIFLNVGTLYIRIDIHISRYVVDDEASEKEFPQVCLECLL